jgi:2'-5' RNA ligase
MGGRFGKYGDFKRRKALQRSRREKTELDRANPIALRSRDGLFTTPKKSSLLSTTKTYKTAVVAIPPDYLWGPIQGLRKQYDRHYRRWMPHVTLLYPFRPVSAFEQVLPLLAQVCRSFKPFEVQLACFDLFAHSHRNATLYLIPKPAKALKALHKALLEIVPDCDDVARFAGGFTPHLSVGQVRRQEAHTLCTGWQATWQPLSFTLTDVYLIWRNDPPDDIFRIGSVLSLGGQ